MKIIKKDYNQYSGDEKCLYEATYEELLKYLKYPPSWELTIETSKGEWDALSEEQPQDILVKDKIYHISEYIPLDGKTFIYIKEVNHDFKN